MIVNDTVETRYKAYSLCKSPTEPSNIIVPSNIFNHKSHHEASPRPILTSLIFLRDEWRRRFRGFPMEELKHLREGYFLLWRDEFGL